MFRTRVRRVALYAGTVGVAGAGALLASRFKQRVSTGQHRDTAEWKAPAPQIKPRAEALNDLKASTLSADTRFDVLVIGGGATGAGIALDAALRGLKVALVERDDFAAGTSSKSTKLVHGGVRYLEKAVLQLDLNQFKLVQEALRERETFLNIAPHLTSWLPIMLPVKRWWEIPYLWAGTKLYDLVAASGTSPASYYLSKQEAMTKFPQLRESGFCAALVYHDGAQDDARMNVGLAVTAATHQATVANYVEVQELTKDRDGKINGAIVQDLLQSEAYNTPFRISARCVINATGPVCDSIRKMDDLSTEPIVVPSSGVHITLPSFCAPTNMGMIDANSPDGRVVFLLPWQGRTIAGTTDKPCEPDPAIEPAEEDVQWILDQVSSYLDPSLDLKRQDILSVWVGIRPLVKDPSATDSQNIVRHHLVDVSDSGLLTVSGGKWTTYRQMAEDTVDAAIKQGELWAPRGHGTSSKDMQIIGAKGWSPTLFARLMKVYDIEFNEAEHLASSYGDQAWHVLDLSDSVHGRTRLSPSHPYLVGEVRYAVRYEYAHHAVDVLARRTRLAFVDAQAAIDALPLVVAIMAEDLEWDITRQNTELNMGLKFLKTML